MTDETEEGNDGPSNVEQTGYEFERGRQQFRDERAAEIEAREEEFKERASAKGCSMMIRGFLLLPAALVLAILVEVFLGLIGFDPDDYPGWVFLIVLVFYVGIPILIALAGALMLLAGCACAEDFTDPIEEELDGAS